MQRFIIRRVLQSLLIIWAVMSLTWLLIALSPGGPEAALVENRRVTKETIAAIREAYGLNKPLYEQYITWMIKVFTLDFGRSYSETLPALQVIAGRIWPSFQLGFFSFLFSLTGIPLGIYAARNRGKFVDNVVRVVTVLGSTMPVWWFSLLLIIILANTVKWFPQGEGKDGFGSWFLNLMIPAALLSISGIVAFSRFVRSETLEVLNQDYVRTANAKGLPANQVNRWHVFRNSLIPVVTIFGYLLPALIGGAVLTETIFNWPGMGRLTIDAVSQRDMPVLLALFLIFSVLTIVGNLLADIGYGLVDPRVRYE